jgi:uncharacterized membrane protein
MMEQDRRLDRYVSGVLHAGMILSISVLALGLLMFVLSPGVETSIPLDRLPEELMHLSPVAVIDLGILLLILTPLARVLAAAAIFAAQRELRFVLASLAVLAAIALAIVL